jgi:hypothetical protein
MTAEYEADRQRREAFMEKFVMTGWRKIFVGVLVLALPLFLIGCGGNGSAPPFNISGNWNITWTPSGSPNEITSVFTFTQASDGSLSVSCPASSSNGAMAGSGSISGQNLSFSFVWTEEPSGSQNTYTFNGTLVVPSNGSPTMSGNWTIPGSNPLLSGTWTGTYVSR